MEGAVPELRRDRQDRTVRVVSMQDLLKEELMEGEKVVWSGQPDRSVLFVRADMFLIPFSLLWCGFVIFWECMAISLSKESDGYVGAIFALFGIPFLLMGAFLLFGRFLWNDFRKGRTYYFVTDKRVIVVTTIFAKSVCAEFIGMVPSMNRVMNTGGTGTIYFGNMLLGYTAYGSDIMDWWRLGINQAVPVFYDIQDVDKVYKTVNELRKVKSA